MCTNQGLMRTSAESQEGTLFKRASVTFAGYFCQYRVKSEKLLFQKRLEIHKCAAVSLNPLPVKTQTFESVDLH